METKDIFIWLFVFVVGSLIVSFLIYPSNFNLFKSNVKGVIPNDINLNVNLPTKSSCKEGVIETTPKYWVSSSKPEEQEMNYWSDGTHIGIFEKSLFSFEDCLRGGSKEGENINYKYYNSKSFSYGLCNEIRYLKQITDSEGNILGFRNFTISPVFKPSSINAEWTDNWEESYFYVYSWNGFTEEVKQIFHTSDFNIKVYIHYYYHDGKFDVEETICEETFTEESGEFSCDLSRFEENKLDRSDQLIVKVSPEVFDNTIYELVDYNIGNCNWV